MRCVGNPGLIAGLYRSAAVAPAIQLGISATKLSSCEDPAPLLLEACLGLLHEARLLHVQDGRPLCICICIWQSGIFKLVADIKLLTQNATAPSCDSILTRTCVASSLSLAPFGIVDACSIESDIYIHWVHLSHACMAVTCKATTSLYMTAAQPHAAHTSPAVACSNRKPEGALCHSMQLSLWWPFGGFSCQHVWQFGDR